MPYPYNIRVTRYQFPLNSPYAIQFWSMVFKDMKRHFKPGRSHTEEIGGVISDRRDIREYMAGHIEKAGFIQSVDDLLTNISGGKKGHFFFLSFIVSYWLNKKMEINNQKESTAF